MKKSTKPKITTKLYRIVDEQGKYKPYATSFNNVKDTVLATTFDS